MVLFFVSVSCSTSELQGFCTVGYESDCDLSSEKILIKRGTVMNAHRKEVAEVYIEVGIVVSVRPNIKVSWCRTKWDDGVSKDMELMVNEQGSTVSSWHTSDDFYCKACRRALPLVQSRWPSDLIYAIYIQQLTLEGEATAGVIRLANFVNAPLYVVHVMSIDAMEEIAKARKEGQRVIGEPVASGYVMSPPIRTSGHDKARRAALSTGVLQLVGTDHCASNSTQKALGYEDFRKIPNGVNGVLEVHLCFVAPLS
ncbi:hypothetical protein OPV22_034102 [Ensete ventricosum]|uniref:Amidohydrolase-related domain-containing protein n=1 Tax=Ensete ventricosum TaxID=4639 RepID=A0AAV8PRI1_ENSVE|nr:hypothetical protein OPV22_034102 [Ensete ventricosum]